MSARRVIEPGTRFTRLTVCQHAGSNKHGRAIYLCKCDCGAQRTLTGNALLRRNTRSCGCLERDMSAARVRARNYRHGAAVRGDMSPTYLSWAAAIARCERESKRGWHRYGGRGIGMCERWRTSFANFLADMGERPAGRTLDRFPDPDGNYEPGNCRWATPLEQARNKSKIKTLPAGGSNEGVKQCRKRTG